MNDQLNIETILGYVANDNPLRASRDGKSFEGMIPPPAWTEVIVKRNGSVTDTVHEMQKIIEHYNWQTAKVAPRFIGSSLYETCNNIWKFLFYHIRYNEDTEGKEELRTFSRTFAERQRGVDCDDFSLAAGSILRYLNIPFYIRIARYAGKDYFQHVYVVVPTQGKEYITIDGVLDEYDTEKAPVETKDFLVMSNKNLSGINISVLGSIEDEALNEMAGILSGADFEEVNNLEGLGTVADEQQELGAIRNYLVRTRNFVAKRPELISETVHPQGFLGMVDYALKYWDTDKRDDALGVLESEENRINELEGLGWLGEDQEHIDLFYGLSEDGTYNLLGKARTKRKFFNKIKQAIKRAGKGIRKAAKGIMRYNPVTAGIRAAVLLALKVNLFKIGAKLKWGYLTQSEAEQHHFNMNEWRKVKKQLSKIENLFVNTLQGKAENFKRAILTGRAGGLSGTDDNLGVVVAAASTAAAVPFLTKIISLLKNINFSKLIEKVDIPSLLKRRKKADSDTPTNDGETAQPEGGQTSDLVNDSSTNSSSDSSTSSEATQTPSATEDTSETTDPNASSMETPSSDDAQNENNSSQDITTTQEGDKTVITSNDNSEESTNDSSETNNASATTDDNGQENATENNPTDPTNTDDSGTDNLSAKNIAKVPIVSKAGIAITAENIFTKAMTWVKDNPKTSVLVGAGAVFLIYEIAKPKHQHALSGTGRGKKRKGKAKKNPPHVISGTEKKHPKPKHHKPHKARGHKKNGKSGNGRKFKL